jgi:hypothetical protein
MSIVWAKMFGHLIRILMSRCLTLALAISGQEMPLQPESQRHSLQRSRSPLPRSRLDPHVSCAEFFVR